MHSILVSVAILCQACSTGDVRSLGPVNSGVVRSSIYRDPDNAFSIKIPDGWKWYREEKDGGYLTTITPEQRRAANLSILSVNNLLPRTESAEQRTHLLVETSKPFFQGWMAGLAEQARVEGTGDIYPTRFADVDAFRTDVTYHRGDADDPRQGYSIFLSGDKNTLFISVTGSRPSFKDLDSIISTLRLDP